jgi:hypothetical protein
LIIHSLFIADRCNVVRFYWPRSLQWNDVTFIPARTYFRKITCVFLLQKRLLHYFFSALVFYHFIFSKLETAQLIFNILSFQIKVKASFDEEQLLHNVSFLTIDSSFEYPQAFYVLKTSLKKSRCVFLLFKLSTWDQFLGFFSSINLDNRTTR